MKGPYKDEVSGILRNTANIPELEKLDEYENALVTLAITKLISGTLEIKSSKDIFTIHRLLFSEVYDWAGEPRCINIYKNEPVLNGLSVNYSDYKNFEMNLNK